MINSHIWDNVMILVYHDDLMALSLNYHYGSFFFSVMIDLCTFFRLKSSFKLFTCSFFFQELVGWYKFRRNSSSRVSLREHSLHRKLLKLMSPGHHEHFLFCLCTASTTTNCSTHAFDHSFQVYVRG